MKINRNIQNVQELRAEIARLKVLKYEQESYLNDQFDLLQERLNGPFNFLQKVSGIFTGSSDDKSKIASFKADWLTNSLRVALPFLFNKVFFRKAGVIKKGLLILASQRAANFINMDRVNGLINQITEWVRPDSKKKKMYRKSVDYGIPPDSETY